VTDLPFPAIDPGAGKEEINRLVEGTFDQLKSLAAGKAATVHLMGEMTFTYALVRRLKDAGVRCVASTTDREVVDNGDGTRTTKFRFVRFRDYE
jgi:2-keto-3-deoxy-L-rhamnonate aldolase RhmA